MIPAADAWGPFAPTITASERIARLRCLTAIAHLSCGPRSVELVAALREAEADAATLPDALASLNQLAPLDRRRIWASYAAITAPTRPRHCTPNVEDHA
ncbi:hypothetical protein [Methylobacterium sp. GC_Met_2]|uniref:hypothetical protein n=1 Tax=Methylobacterium sp. GC_Met_2 TaxID=2937376 RepID=UPI00226BA1C0|nr:hypothetical protein [Methylobacterium sp. GC_Met_2]